MSDRKNILILCMDDAFAFWRFRTAFGEELKLPNLDRICERSTAFHSAYCQVPVCGPSRASFLSGLAPHQTGVFDNYSDIFEILRPEQMWSYRLKQAGYYCSTAGKLHHGYRPRPPEIHDALYSHTARKCYLGPAANAPAKDFGGLLVGLGTTDPKDDRKYYDYYSSNDAVRFLESYDGDAPFYREVGFHNPHPPFKTPVRFKEMYDEDGFVMPNAWAEEKDPDPFGNNAYPTNFSPTDRKRWQKSVRNYFSGYSHVDWHIGRVWDALQASKHAKNTIVIICADHGYHMGDKNRFRKYTLWEEAANVPMIIYDPDRDAGQVVTDPVALIDVGPTVMDYAGLPPLDDCPGRSLRPQVDGETVEGRSAPTFWFGSVGIRNGDHRYILYQDGSDQLFDLTVDPWQLKNIAQGHPRRAELHQALIDTARSFGLTMGDATSADAGPTGYVSAREGGPAPTAPGARGLFSFEPPGSDTPDVPGDRKIFIRMHDDMTVDMPAAYRHIYYAADVGDGPNLLTIRCNDRGSHVNMIGGHARCRLRIEGGRGDDWIEGAQEPMEVHLTAGNNRVDAGFRDATVHGGSGDDTIHCQRGENLVYGGSGRSLIVAGIGKDLIHTGPGTAEVVTGTGEATIVVDGGSNLLRLTGTGPVALVFHRTGLPQRVAAYTGGRIDISDWAPLGPAEVVKSGKDTILTAGGELVRFLDTKIDTVRAGLDRPAPADG